MFGAFLREEVVEPVVHARPHVHPRRLARRVDEGCLTREAVEDRALFLSQLLRQLGVRLDQRLGVSEILQTLRTPASRIAASGFHSLLHSIDAWEDDSIITLPVW